MKHFVLLLGAILPQPARAGSKICQEGFNHLLITLMKVMKSIAEGPDSILASTGEKPG